MARVVAPLTDAVIKKLEVREKPYNKADGGGLYLWVSPFGSKIFKFHYILNAKRSKVTIGEYPVVTLQEAREIVIGFKRVVREGRKPRLKDAFDELRLFEDVAIEYLQSATMAKNTRNGYIAMLKNHVFVYVGNMDIKIISKNEMVEVFTAMGKKGMGNTVKKLRGLLSRIFEYSRTKGYSESNPMSIDVYLLAPKKEPKNFRYITEERDIEEMMKKIEGYNATLKVAGVALKIIPHVFVRNSNLISAEWSELDLEAKLWTIPSKKMKTRRDFLIPLSDVVVALFKEVEYTRTYQGYVFHSGASKHGHISDGTILMALKRLGINSTAHGLRHLASTVLNEKRREIGVSADAIELQLAHEVRGVRGVYNKALLLDERKELMDWWSNYLVRLTKR